MGKTAVIIGAGPAGLTAAYELARQSDIRPIVLEASGHIGGLARTLTYRGNRLDIGGHRFFTKSDRVLRWWLDMLPLQRGADAALTRDYHRRTNEPENMGEGPDPDSDTRVMLVRGRRSSILFEGRLYPYPLQVTPRLLRQLGIGRAARIGLSYLRRVVQPVRPVRNLEDFMINRFGDTLYHTFFRSYSEKVWGVPCREISAEWGAQRIKSLSIGKTLLHWLRGPATSGRTEVATSLAEQFLYPKHGPGQLWEEAARRVEAHGGAIRLGHRVTALRTEGRTVREVEAVDEATGARVTFPADYVFSTMAIPELVAGLGAAVPAEVGEVAAALPFRDFITVGVLARGLRLRDPETGGPLRESWLYVQDPRVRLGRLQFYNNWSRYMVADPAHQWLGLEYFCRRGDALWDMADTDFLRFAGQELELLGVLGAGDLIDGVVVRVEKAYPAYTGAYARFDEVRRFLDGFANLFCIGRNGMHKYNNQDHSMLTAMLAVENVLSGAGEKDNLWAVNAGDDYLEEADA